MDFHLEEVTDTEAKRYLELTRTLPRMVQMALLAWIVNDMVRQDRIVLRQWFGFCPVHAPKH